MAGFQGLGLALAAGVLAGAVAPAGQARWVLGALAAVLGGFLFGASLTPEGHPAWPGWLVGAPAALFAFVAISDVARAARERAGDGALGVALYLGAGALILAGLSLLPTAPVSVLALVGIVWLYFGRRRRAGEKYAGLRSLR